MNIIQVSQLIKAYPKPENKKETFNAVDGISFDIEEGEIYGLLVLMEQEKLQRLKCLKVLKI